MAKGIREKGKIKLSEYYKKLNLGDRVAVVEELSIPSNIKRRFLGRTGVIIGSRGSHKIIKLNDGNMEKRFIIHPIHLKKLR